MKNYFVIFFLFTLFTLFLTSSALAQETFITSNNIAVTCNKTTHLIFPYAIRSIDRGSQDVLAQKAPGSDNVLQLKAAKAGFTETNVTVITADNKLYPFKVNYSLAPEHLTISFVTDRSELNPKNGMYCSIGQHENNIQSNVETLQNTVKQVAAEKKRMYALHARSGLVHLLLKGLYIKNDVFYFQFMISNLSNISFSIQNIAFTIKDSRKAKRKAVQERVLQPLLTNETDSSVQSHSSGVRVVALPKFTLENGKYLSIRVFEENGGRNLVLKVYNRHLLAAKPL
ncbi:conjugative transposon protein TraN [Ilyomonas limi]|uniref:Conjugative transposon protein TraN n=1 Tax=Ilyomonas limi TaxID=2575867 RepID=A0A4U3KQR1_9BACT|nr:conjugative transposon protein TraN [Ilyomonas limi]TKK64705.1 conjugative transposon protein TraN [Ilyomonas limi]